MRRTTRILWDDGGELREDDLRDFERIVFEGAFVVVYKDASFSSDPVRAYSAHRVVRIDFA